MKKISFSADVLPHLLAIVLFFIITTFFFNPIFFENKALQQGDIQQFIGSSKAIADYRNATGEEALWTNSMFSGMPAYLISVQWGNQAIGYIKAVMGLLLPHPIASIFIAFICYYILLLTFRIRPYLAIAGAVAFGLSSYIIVGLAAGHNGRVGAIAFMPLIMAGLHLAFSGKRVLGFGVTAAAMALHLRENHIQMTYYLLLIVLVYGLIRLLEAIKLKTLPALFKTVGILVVAVLLGAGTFFGQFWAVTQYTKYTIRGASELTRPGADSNGSGLSKEYAFAYKYGILEPMTLLIPEFYGGSSANLLVTDQESNSYKALVRTSDNQVANQLANYTSAYWGPQSFTSAPYYAGAIVIFLLVVGILFAERKYVWWLVPLSVLSIMLSWGDSFSAFNYFMFDYFPGYNKFRSVNFALIIILFAMPLLGLLGVERLWQNGTTKEARKKLLIAFSSTGGICLFFVLFPGILSFTKEFEEQLPAWFINALADDRKSLLRSDAFRSFAFILSAFIILYFDLHRKISPVAVCAFLIFMITIDLWVVNKRYLTSENFKRKRDNSFFALTEADQEILKDNGHYRVYNLQNPFIEARTSYYHSSIGGYHGAKLRRYQDFLDSCLLQQTEQFVSAAQQGQIRFENFNSINMLNAKYLVYGPQRNNVIVNPLANGAAWFVQEVIRVNTPAEELEHTCEVNTKTTAVIDASKFDVPDILYDTTWSIRLTDLNPKYLKYESASQASGLAVFSEIYYPLGWVAKIDGKEVPILRANYILRALEIPAGTHTIEFTFEPQPYIVGNKVTSISSWMVLLVLLGSIGWSLRRNESSSKPS